MTNKAKFDTKTCPMCGGALALRMPPAGSSDYAKRYICSTHIPDTKISHYHVSVRAPWAMQVIQAPPFFVHGYLESEKFEIWGFKNNSHIKIMDVPVFPLENIDSVKLGQRIRLWILFS